MTPYLHCFNKKLEVSGFKCWEKTIKIHGEYESWEGSLRFSHSLSSNQVTFLERYILSRERRGQVGLSQEIRRFNFCVCCWRMLWMSLLPYIESIWTERTRDLPNYDTYCKLISWALFHSASFHQWADFTLIFCFRLYIDLLLKCLKDYWMVLICTSLIFIIGFKLLYAS